MATTVVGTIVDGSNVPVEGARVTARLVAGSDPDAPGYVGTAEVFGDSETVTDDTGAWSLDLIANADITPADTVYAISYVAAGRDFLFYIEVPDSEDDEWVGDLLTVLPAGLERVELDDLADVSTSGATDGQALVYDDGTDSWGPGTVSGGPGGGAPTDAAYLVTAANGSLSAEVVVGATPGGELGGTWDAPTVDTTHSGSSHAGVQAAAEATAAGALSSHESDTTNIHGITDTSVLATATDVSTAVSNHSSDTTSVHGIADTSALATTTDVTNAVSAHTGDTSDAHDASAISVADTAGNFTGTDVEAALAEVVATPAVVRVGTVRNRRRDFEDFDGFVTTITSNGALLGSTRWAVALSGTATQVTQQQGSEFLPGVVALETGTDNGTGRCSIAPVGGLFSFSQSDVWKMSAAVKIPTLSGGGQTFSVKVGFIDDLTGASVQDGFWFRANDGDTNWQTVNSDDGTTTNAVNDTGAAIGTGWNMLKIIYDGTTVNFYVNGSLVVSENGQLPDSTEVIAPCVAINKTAGATSRNIRVDAISYDVAYGRSGAYTMDFV